MIKAPRFRVNRISCAILIFSLRKKKNRDWKTLYSREHFQLGFPPFTCDIVPGMASAASAADPHFPAGVPLNIPTQKVAMKSFAVAALATIATASFAQFMDPGLVSDAERKLFEAQEAPSALSGLRLPIGDGGTEELVRRDFGRNRRMDEVVGGDDIQKIGRILGGTSGPCHG